MIIATTPDNTHLSSRSSIRNWYRNHFENAKKDDLVVIDLRSTEFMSRSAIHELITIIRELKIKGVKTNLIFDDTTMIEEMYDKVLHYKKSKRKVNIKIHDHKENEDIHECLQNV